MLTFPGSYATRLWPQVKPPRQPTGLTLRGRGLPCCVPRRLLFLLLAGSTALATRMWTPEEHQRFEQGYTPRFLARPESLLVGPRRFNYLERIRLTCDFLARYQVSDSLSPDFGGIIEAEHLPTVIETDNTQEAIWVWSRWRELTGRDDYATELRRAWTYVRRFPAYREHGGNPQNVWYAVWNCGLGFMAESEYRQATGDSSYRAYADSCRRFFLANPLGAASALDWFVTGQSAGMAADYARAHGDALLRDSALARGLRVKAWLEAGAAQRLAYQNWAMCGATAFWGVAHAWCLDDTAAGRQWLARYADSLPGFYPGASWNCSHNIWLANACRSAAQLTGAESDWLLHHYLVDTLLMKDTDRDGGIPATWTDPSTQDQTWVSTYLNFMGTDVFVTPTFEHDVGPLEFVSPSPRDYFVVGDTIPVRVPLANVGRSAENNVWLWVAGADYADSLRRDYLPFCAVETLSFRPVIPTHAGDYQLDAISGATPDLNPRNDTTRVRFRVHGRLNLTGTVTDSFQPYPLHAWVKARISGNPVVQDSCETDRSGRFRLSVIDTTISLAVEPFAPYYPRQWLIPVHGDTDVTLRLPAAQLLLVNTDTANRYSSYYTSTLDTLGLSWCEWFRRDSALPWNVIDRFRLRTAIWYSGDAITGTVPPEDRDSLAAFLDRGANLILTGQNICQELAGTPFLESTLGCRFDSSGTSRYIVFGDRSDSLGRLMPGTSTAGAGGAGNQTSRDAVTPLPDARPFLVYDTLSATCAATRRRLPSGARAIVLGFGFESVNRPNSRPTYFTRVQLMNLMLDWLCGPTALAEQPPFTARPSPAATIVRGTLHVPVSSVSARSSLFSLSGREVMRLAPGANDVRHLPAGIYFLRSSGPALTRRILIID